MEERKINVIGAGLAGSEAALTLSKAGKKVRLFECKPIAHSPAHHSNDFGELVCSNSLKSDVITTASGLLKAELRLLNCELLKIADKVKVPAGSALAVDREKFSNAVTRRILDESNIEVVNEVVEDFNNDDFTIIATGPLTLDSLSGNISKKIGSGLHFYDAAAPVISGDSIDYDCTFTADRYGKGDGDYVNCPMNKDEYNSFVSALVSAECAELHEFEKSEIFEGCMPVEVMAKRGVDTLRFGPLRPVGFRDNNGLRPYAVVQLRRENTAGESYNIVGFQTNLKFKEQERVFRMIPALKNADFLRYGVMHRNTFVNAPETINRHFETLNYPNVYIAGQLSGVEGYVESIMSGLIAARSIIARLNGKAEPEYPRTSIIGALCSYLETPNKMFQPMNANFGLLPPPTEKIRDKTAKKLYYSEKSLKDLKNVIF